MIFAKTAALAVVAGAVASAGVFLGGPAPSGACPPSGFQSAQGFNLTAYADNGRPWYSLAAMPVAYQKENHNYCSQARYVIESPHKVAVTNFARDGGVDGPATGGPLCAVPSTESTSQLAVGPCFIPSALYGPYWIIDGGLVGPDNALMPSDGSRYDWAIISGGPPTHDGAGGLCKTGSGINKSGLWLFSRAPVVPAAVTKALMARAVTHGFDVSVLKLTAQANCTYPSV
eukprot:TRINITY_DN89_c0_g1_i1.p1 TRINITY_DN89_c0_g1~~TRINITY_DN89_c0_g1_i1.p1  ORF type:complete len:230 (+),score=69.00 TRINITY_DN89_c0_g1_i1:146-835(+)